MVDGVAWSEIRSETEKYRLFQQRDDGFASFGSCGDHTTALSVSGEPSLNGSPTPRPTKCQNHSIIPDKEKSVMTVEGISSWSVQRNEWGRLREAFVGIEDDYVEPEYIPAFAWMGQEAIEYCKKYEGRKSSEVLPEKIRTLKEQIEGHVKALQDFGTVVHRRSTLLHPEEQTFLDNVQKVRPRVARDR